MESRGSKGTIFLKKVNELITLEGFAGEGKLLVNTKSALLDGFFFCIIERAFPQ